MSLIKWHDQWPGGIPSSIRQHEKPVQDVAFATRAWRCFVREQWVNVDGTAVDQQRRVLVERWATAEQEFRDSYESQAPDDDPCFEDPEKDACLVGRSKDCSSDVYICLTEWTPEKQALLAKIILTLFNGLDGSFKFDFLATNISMMLPFEDNQGDIVDKFKFLQSVARPNFFDIHMALDGTVLFTDTAPKLVIDDRTLETGLALWVQFESNGMRELVYRPQMLMEEFPYFYLDIHYNSEPLDNALIYMEDSIEEMGPESILEDEPVAMRRPFMEIYLSSKDISDYVDLYAPGFREAENSGGGLAIGYDLERILVGKGRSLMIVEDGLYPQQK